MGIKVIGSNLVHKIPEKKKNEGGEGSSIIVDSELSLSSENPVQNKVITKALNDLEENIENNVQGAVDDYLDEHPTVSGTFTNEAKHALLSLLEKVAYIDEDGQEYLDTLEQELFTVAVASITAVYTQSGTVYDTDDLDSLRDDLVVTAGYVDGTSETVTTYTLSGTLTVGTSTITVSYGGKTDTFDVTVTEKLYQYVEYVESDGAAWIISGTIPMDTMGECKFKYNVVPNNADGSLCAKYSSTQNQRYYMANCNSVNNFTFATRDNSTTYTISAADTNIHTEIYNNADHQAIHDGVVKGTNAKFACTAGTAGVDEIVFFARQHSGANPGAGRIYYAKFTDNTTGNLIADYRPCYRISDGAIGFHELVSDTFYGKSGGSGTLTKGEDLPD